ncbi:MAG: hypothetical protein M0P16_00050 [Syntrophales bacterium]|jgi:HEAT repeat protein|nr:hypothetical protein [Syntrophales bacterium]MCK9390376.1 hypothetical protein [Syntrophales bacterium]
MTDNWVKQKALEILVIMNTAIINLRLYPPTSAMIINTIDRLNQALQMVFERESYLIISEAEKNLLIGDEPLSQKDLERPQIAAFIELLLNFGVKSVTFNNGLTRADLSSFLEIMGEKPVTIKQAGGLPVVMAQKNVSHILLDHKIYIATDSKHQFLARLEIKDDDIIQYLIGGADSGLDLDVQQVKELAQNADWLEQVFKNGMSQLINNKDLLPNIQLSENMVRMLGILDKIVDKMDQDKFAHLIAKSIADLDADMIGLVLTQGIDQLFNGKLFQEIINEIDGAKFEQVLEIIGVMESGKSLTAMNSTITAPPGFISAYQRLMSSDKGVELKQRSEEEKTREKDEKGEKIRALKQEIEPILRGHEESFMNPSLMASIAGFVENLTDHEEFETADALIDRLAEALMSDKQGVRDHAAATLVKVIDNLPEKRQKEVVCELSETLTKWINRETSITMAYKKICSRLKDQIAAFIGEKHYAECLPLLNIFHLIDYGMLDKNETAQKIASDIIMELSPPERLDMLFESYATVREKEQKDLGRVLSRLGYASLGRLMDILRDHPDSDERVKILHLLIEVGQPALPFIRNEALRDHPWFFHRNLAYLLGHIKGPTTIEALQTMLMHKHDKVRQEALNSLYRVGESEKGPVLLSILPAVDDAFKISIIEMLGKIKYKKATPVLVEIMKVRPFIVSLARIDLEEMICVSLGRIGAPEAVSLLTEISNPKFFSITTYHKKVKNAAARALAAIKP